jgi:glycosyltransferase involved in cell wall biosynthesis
MKILLLQETDWFEKGPLQQHHLMERLSLKGHEIRVIDYEIVWKTHGKKELKSKREVFENVSKVYDGANITVIRPPIIKIPTLDYISLLITRQKEIERQISEFKPDVIVGFQILTPYLGLKIARRNNIPFIYYWTDVYHAQIPFKLYRPLGKLIEKKILKRSNAVVVINDVLKDFVLAMGSDPNKTYVEKAGMDFSRFNSEISGNKVRKKFGLQNNDIVLLFVGWLYNFSGLQEVVKEIAKVKNDYKKIKFMVVGEGDAFNEILNLVKENKLEDHVILTGKQPFESVPNFIAASDICLLPSHNNEIMKDIVPIKFYEYMAMKKPVISTKLPGVMREFGEDNGVLYVAKPEKVFYEALKLIKNDFIQIEGKKAFNFVEKNDWDDIACDFEKIMGDLK